MRRETLAAAACAALVACGGGHGADDTRDGPGDDTGQIDASGGGDDGGGGGDASGGAIDANGGGDDGGGGEPDAAMLVCNAGLAPTSATTMTSVSNLNFVTILAAGGQVFATAPFGVPASTWLRWTGTAWSQETIPWPAEVPSSGGISAVVQLPTGNALLVSGQWLTIFDGTTMTPAVQAPTTAGTPFAYAQTTDGALHVFGMVGTPTGNAAVEVVQTGSGDWYPAAPVPIPGSANNKVAIATAGDRIVVAYTNVFFDPDEPVHVHVISRGLMTTWTADTDITPTWAVHAYSLRALAPPGGGAILGASGAGSVIWRSTDGVTYGEYEQASAYGWLSAIHAQCLESPIVVAGYQTAYRLEARIGGTWTTLKDRSLDYIDNAGGVILPDGKTFFALGETNQHEYFATP